MAGRPTVFVRTGGCDFRCTWCDTMHAVDPKHKADWQPRTALEVMREVWELAGKTPILITLSGGNPALQPLWPLIDLAHQGFLCEVAMETQGSIAKPWFKHLDHLILSPKPPSSGMPFKPERLQECIAATDCTHGGLNGPVVLTKLSLKVVVMDEADYQFARMIWREFAVPHRIPFYLTPGNGNGNTPAPFNLQEIIDHSRWLVARVAVDHWYEPTIIPQLHTFLWGSEKGR